MIRPLALALVTACLALGMAPQHAAAAPACPHPRPVVAMQRATAVFTGVVASAAPQGTSFVQQVTLDRVYKGEVIGGRVRVRTTTGRCGLGQLTQGERYVVMATPDGDSWLAGPRSGTAAATDALLARVQATLGQGTAPTTGAGAPAEVAYDQVGPTHPRSFLRAAAPGFALVIAGLLGLLGVAVARRRTA